MVMRRVGHECQAVDAQQRGADRGVQQMCVARAGDFGGAVTWAKASPAAMAGNVLARGTLTGTYER
ncbi:hypothetical protein A5641_17010 [Mycobacterium sp. 1554424.7]|nr:hypothetical protein A5641_17010 [Mycobacterium sp. 1554424.7]